MDAPIKPRASLTLAEFHTSVLRTVAVPGEVGVTPVRQLVWACGLAGELSEYLGALWDDDYTVLEEAGDLMWYIAALSHSVGLSVDRLNHRGTPIEPRPERELVRMVGAVCELLKKHRGHGKPLDRDALAEYLAAVLAHLEATLQMRGCSLGQVAAKNDAKLRQRYPDGFKLEYRPSPPVELEG